MATTPEFGSKKYPEDRLPVLQLDVTKPGDITAAFEAAVAHFGRIDVVFKNVGHTIQGEAEATPHDSARNMFDVNFWGAANVTHEAVRVFREVNKPRGSRLLQMSSISGVRGSLSFGYYCATKHVLKEAGAGEGRGKDKPFTFIYISGNSAGPTKKSSQMWARVKGRTERDLTELYNSTPGINAHVFRPAYATIGCSHRSPCISCRGPDGLTPVRMIGRLYCPSSDRVGWRLLRSHRPFVRRVYPRPPCDASDGVRGRVWLQVATSVHCMHTQGQMAPSFT
ncbi:hypothetical protein C8Q72DRAFT_946961 [Fomitopsis betulina]|nr:hypothetical protein C8Q72DRAFT_946961 [Fomitopsis betulina]